MAAWDGALLKSLYEKSLSGTGTDLVFKVGPRHEVVHAHTLIVTAASPVFKSMLKSCWDVKNESGKVVQELPVDDPNHFKNFVKLMYGFSGYTSSDFEELFPVYQMADKYQTAQVQTALTNFAASLASSRLTVANVVDIHLSAKKYKILELEMAAENYILLNIKELWKSDSWLDMDEEALTNVLAQDDLCGLDLKSIQLKCVDDCCKPRCNNSNCAKTNIASQNEQLIFRKVFKWIEHQKAKGSEEEGFVTRILSHVRVCQMTSNDFIQALKNANGILTAQEMGEILVAKLESEHDGVSRLQSLGPGRRELMECIDGFPFGTCTHSVSQRFEESEGIFVCLNNHITFLKKDMFQRISK